MVKYCNYSLFIQIKVKSFQSLVVFNLRHQRAQVSENLDLDSILILFMVPSLLTSVATVSAQHFCMYGSGWKSLMNDL